MRAVTISEPGGPEVLTWTEVADPVCGPAENPVPSLAEGDAAADVPPLDAGGRGEGAAGEPQTLQ